MREPEIKLHVVPSQGSPFERPFTGDSMVIGRASECDLVIEDRFLSRRHSRLFLENGRLMVEDLGSRNGTQVNGHPIIAAKEVGIGDLLKISGSVVSLRRASDPVSVLSGFEEQRKSQRKTIYRKASSLLSEAPTAREIEDTEALRRFAERLKLLNEVHQALASSIDLGELLELILDRVFDHLQPGHGAIFLRVADGEYEQAAGRSTVPGRDDHYHSQSLLEEVAGKGLAALVFDIEDDHRFAGAQSLLMTSFRSIVAAPLLDPEGSQGMIVLSAERGRRFQEEDMELLVSLANVAALALRNVALAEEAAERRHLEEELALGRRIQVALLPDHLPVVPGYELFANNLPSRGVSGDYYQILERREGRELILMVADVSGKGIGASLLTASLEALAAGPIEDGHPPEDIFRRISRRLYQRTSMEKYATAVLVVIDTESGRIRFANAGHNPVLILEEEGEVRRLEATGPPLGIFAESDYERAELQLAPGATLLLYTDGLTEGTNPQEEEYGLDRLIEAARAHLALDLEALSIALSQDLRRFAQGTPLLDDLTLVMARRARHA